MVVNTKLYIQLQTYGIVPDPKIPLHSILVRVSIAVKRHHGHGKSYKGKHLIGAGLQFRGLGHYHHGGNESVQADMVLEKRLRVHLALQATGSELSHWAWLEHI